jgi:hypothetical protein
MEPSQLRLYSHGVCLPLLLDRNWRMEKELGYAFGKVGKAARLNVCKEGLCWLLMVAFLEKPIRLPPPLPELKTYCK